MKIINSQSKQILQDLDEYQDLEENIKQIIENIQYYEQEQFDNWEQEIQTLIHRPDNPLRPELNEQLLQMKEGELIVNFSERLVLLIRETR